MNCRPTLARWGRTLQASVWKCALVGGLLAVWASQNEAAADEKTPYITQRTSLTIPFTVAAGNADFKPVEVQVFVSYDQGKSWHLYSRHRPEEGEFLFRTKRDGEYWFATRTLDSKRKMYPDTDLKPQLQVIVDTTPPVIELTAEVQAGGEVGLTWKMRDEALEPNTFELAYQTASTLGQNEWIDMPLEYPGRPDGDAVVGHTTWVPQTQQRVINVRAQVKDKAGNPATVHRQVFLPRIGAKPELAAKPAVPGNAIGSASPPPTNSVAQGTPQRYLPPVPANGATSTQPTEIPPAAIASTQPTGTPWPANANSSGSSPNLANHSPPPRPEGPGRLASSEGSSGRTESSPPSQNPVYPVDNNPLPFNSNPTPPPQPQPSATSPAPAPSTVPPTENWLSKERPRLTRSKRFTLDYEVDSVSPENLGDVELWGTSDGGRSWMKWGSDNDRQSPFEVEVGNEAIYGFCIVIVARNGVSSKPPQAGDSADIWIQVDTSPPAVRLTQAAYGNGERAGQLDIRWEADDANLADRPITLSFADRADGPFTTIAAGLPNNGQFWWPFDPRAPRQIYLRIEAVDAAGNVGLYSLPQPISVEGLIPRGRIRALSTPDAAGQEAMLRSRFR